VALLFEVVVEDRHLELIGDLALIVVAEDDADELLIDEDLGGIVLPRPLAHLDVGQPEDLLEIMFELKDFVPSHRSHPTKIALSIASLGVIRFVIASDHLVHGKSGFLAAGEANLARGHARHSPA
jgi:hypothetical protein